MSSRLKEQYQSEIVEALTKKFGYKNVMEVPKLDKIVINMGVGDPWLTSKSERVCPSDVKLLCVATECMSSQIA